MANLKNIAGAALVIGSAVTLCWAGEPKASNSKSPVLVKPKGYIAAKPSPESEAGQLIYESAHCSACHAINNDGGQIGPLLDGIGAHRKPDFLYALLADSDAARQLYARSTGQKIDQIAPHVRVPEKMGHALVAYLETIPEPRGGFAVFGHGETTGESNSKPQANYKPQPQSQSSEEGKKLYEKFRCAACHEIQHTGGYIGPTLDGIGRLRSPDFIEKHVTDAQVQAVTEDKFFELVPTSMPKFDATPAEVRKIRDYLLSLPAE